MGLNDVHSESDIVVKPLKRIVKCDFSYKASTIFLFLSRLSSPSCFHLKLCLTKSDEYITIIRANAMKSIALCLLERNKSPGSITPATCDFFRYTCTLSPPGPISVINFLSSWQIGTKRNSNQYSNHLKNLCNFWSKNRGVLSLPLLSVLSKYFSNSIIDNFLLGILFEWVSLESG